MMFLNPGTIFAVSFMDLGRLIKTRYVEASITRDAFSAPFAMQRYAINSVDQFFPASGVVKRVYWFGARDFGMILVSHIIII